MTIALLTNAPLTAGLPDDRRSRVNAISLFSGVGGFELGFERAGISTVLQCEIDPVALSVLRRHWPDVPKVEDVRTLTAATVARIFESAPDLGRHGVLAGGNGRADPVVSTVAEWIGYRLMAADAETRA